MENYFDKNWSDLEDILVNIQRISSNLNTLNTCLINVTNLCDPHSLLLPTMLLSECVEKLENWIESGLDNIREQKKSEVA